MEELSLDNILSEDQISELFEDSPEEKENNEETATTEVDTSELFEDLSESVGSEDKNTENSSSTEVKSSPNFYSSIANALVEEGIFQDLDDEALSNIKSAEDFASEMTKQMRSQLDEQQKRIAEALDLGVEPTEIKKYESYLATLNNITEEQLTDESGENIRKNLIYQDYINRRYSKEKAIKMVERSLDAGTDIDDAKDALQSNKEFFQTQYNKLIEDAKLEQQQAQRELQNQVESFKKTILEDKKAFGEIDLDKNTKQRVYDTIMKPVYTDPETGAKFTALQKYEKENKMDFLKNIGLMYVLTDGFKKLDNLVQGKVKKELKKGLRELENTINSTSRNTSGNLNFISGVNDPESKFSGWSLNI